MTKRPQSRKPAAFSLDDPDIIVGPQSEESGAPHRPSRDKVLVTPTPDEAASLPVEQPAPARRRGLPWGAIFWSSLSALLALALGVATTQLIDDLFARAEWLGYLATGLAALIVLALIVIVGREIFGLMRLAKIDHLRDRASAILVSDDRDEGRALIRDLLSLTGKMPRLARARAQLQGHLGDIIDGADLVRLAERELMPSLDAQARQLVSDAAKRVSVVTAVSPRALIDVLFVAMTAFGLMRRLAVLYGGRPGTLGLITLFRHVISHMTVTGGVAIGDSLIQQIVGHGVAARLSAKLGEGVLNGLLTARLGLAAIEVTRPLPFATLPKPTVSDLAGSVLRARQDSDQTE